METGMKNLIHAARVSRKAHAGQTRKHGTPYHEHPAAVARLLWSAGWKESEILQAAYLHDVAEDAPEVWAAVGSKFSKKVQTLVETLTKKKSESLESYYARVKAAGPEAVALKTADRTHNNSQLGLLPPGHPVVAKAHKKTEIMRKAFAG